MLKVGLNSVGCLEVNMKRNELRDSLRTGCES